MSESDLDYGLELPGIYDGVCLWVYLDGTVENRFTPDWGRRYELVEAHIDREGLIRRSPPK